MLTAKRQALVTNFALQIKTVADTNIAQLAALPEGACEDTSNEDRLELVDALVLLGFEVFVSEDVRTRLSYGALRVTMEYCPMFEGIYFSYKVIK